VTGCCLLLLAGCSPSGPQRYDHWGTITYKDKPIPAGILYFDPDLAAPNDGPQGLAIIKDGKYDTRLRPESGPGSGKYLIRVDAADGIAAPEAPVGKMIFTSQVLIKIDLPAEATEVNVVIPPETR
jgi:hypothetical protein